jgi:hypothetical protein
MTKLQPGQSVTRETAEIERTRPHAESVKMGRSPVVILGHVAQYIGFEGPPNLEWRREAQLLVLRLRNEIRAENKRIRACARFRAHLGSCRECSNAFGPHQWYILVGALLKIRATLSLSQFGYRQIIDEALVGVGYPHQGVK